MIEVKVHQADSKIEYPCLMKAIEADAIILFVSATRGFRIRPHLGEDVEEGFIPANHTSYWEKFNGKIELSNEVHHC